MAPSAIAQEGGSKFLDIIAVDDGSAFRSTQPLPTDGSKRWIPEAAWATGFTRFRDRVAHKFPYAELALFNPRKPPASRDLDANDARQFLEYIRVRRLGHELRPVQFIAYGAGIRLLRLALKHDGQRPPSDQVLHDVPMGIILLLSPGVGRRGSSKNMFDRRASVVSIMRSAEDEELHFLFLRKTRNFQLTCLHDWKPESNRATLSYGLRRSLSGFADPFRPLKEYHPVFNGLESQLLEIYNTLVYTGARAGDATFVTTILQEVRGVAEHDKPVKSRLMTDALFVAIEHGKANVVKILFGRPGEASADVSARNPDRLTPLALASYYGFDHVVDVLIRHGADVNSEEPDKKSPLIIACQRGHCSTVIRILQSCKTIDRRTLLEQTALMLAAEKGYTPIVRALLERHAAKELKDYRGRTALVICCERAQNETAQALLENRADVNARTFDQSTPLHISASTGNEALARILLQEGADETITNQDGKAAASLSTSENILQLLRGAAIYRECLLPQPDLDKIQKLLDKEGDIEYKGSDGRTALQVAYDRKMTELQQILEDPPLTSGPMSYINLESNERLEWPTAKDPDCVAKVQGAVIDFHVQDGKEKRIRARPNPDLGRLIYRDQSIPACQLLAKRYKGSEMARFRYYHLPANNLTWAKDLMTRIALEQNADCDARDFEETLTGLLTTNDWRHLAINYSRRDKNFPFLRPQATTVRKVSSSSEQLQENIVLFMPYLHYESSAKYKDMEKVISNSLKAPPDGADVSEQIIHTYLNAPYPMHPRRSLDQFYYSPIDTEQRDYDQVVYRYMQKHMANSSNGPKMFMVDQLWLWILNNGKTLITCFPREWKIKDKHRNNPLHDVQKTDVLSSILKKLNSQDRPEIYSAYEMAALVAYHCFGTFFDPTRGLGDSLQFMEFFERSIGIINDKETSRFQALKAYLEDDAKNEGKSKGDQLQELLEISEEVILLDEIKDIRDELSIIDLVFDQQIVVIENMVQLLRQSDGFQKLSKDTQDRRDSLGAQAMMESSQTLPSKKDAAARRKGYSFDSLLLVLQQKRASVQKMNERALRVYNDIHALLDLKQKQASVYEAEKARDSADRQEKLLAAANKQAEVTAKQGKTLMVFTLTTIIFLPASFMAAFFAIQIDSFPKAGGQLNMPLPWVVQWLVVVTVVISSPLILLAFYIDSLQQVASHGLVAGFALWVYLGWRGLVRWVRSLFTRQRREEELDNAAVEMRIGP